MQNANVQIRKLQFDHDLMQTYLSFKSTYVDEWILKEGVVNAY